ncbi:RNA methyltransferase, TrmA family protein [Minicystis rosea]|nr:RNA methyltransferase, TrmA family protein [Minicystis rosea]
MRETLRIESVAAGGAGVAHLPNGAVVFVPRTAPGDVIEAEVITSTQPASGRVLRVIEPSADRVDPPCPYVEACGGCDLMHLSATAQERAHTEMVRSALSRALPNAKLPEIRVHVAPTQLAYRTRARFFLKADRRGVRVGYRAPSSHDLTSIDACLVLDPAIAPLLAELREVLAGASGDGDAQVARGRDGRPVVSLAWRGELPASAWSALDARVTRGAWAGARVVLHGAGQPATFGDPRPVIAGADGAPLVIAPGGFAQPSDDGAVLLARRADELARIEDKPRPRHVVELFAGSGTLSILLAQGAASFTAVEIDEAACAAARENLTARGLAAKVVTADADAASISPNTTIVVLDPPRTGARGAAATIAASSARVVVYVACDPPTLARDLTVLTGNGRFAVTDVEIFELFPQTSHVETVVRLERVR